MNSSSIMFDQEEVVLDILSNQDPVYRVCQGQSFLVKAAIDSHFKSRVHGNHLKEMMPILANNKFFHMIAYGEENHRKFVVLHYAGGDTTKDEPAEVMVKVWDNCLTA